MGLTHVEFLRLIPAAIGRGEYWFVSNRIEGNGEGVEWSLVVVERSKRRIALLALAVLEVTLSVTVRADLVQPFIDRFLLAHQRAGG